jgi:hypothetical protein
MFRILLEVCIAHLGSIFDKHIEIHLSDRKYQSRSKNPQTHTWQPICCLLHFKSALGIQYIYIFKSCFIRVF